MIDPNSTLLVVEDDQRLRYLTEVVLKERFEHVLVASRADEALQLFNDAEVGAVFTDIMMPGGMDGLAMAKLMRESRPEIPILMASGDTGFKAPDWPRCGFLAKPYSKDQLFNALEAVAA